MRFLLTLFFLFTGFALLAQNTQDSATYNRAVGVQETLFPTVNSTSGCADTLSISIPSGNWIYGVDLYYTVETVGGFFGNAPDDIEVYLECITQSASEPQLYAGTSNVNGATENISRTNLNFANGAVTGTQVDFALHAFENTFFGSGCDTNDAKIQSGSWKVVLHHGPAPTCLKPSNPQVDYVMHNKARVSWNSGGASNWQIEYGTAGFTPGTGTLINATTNPFVISGLSPSTSYEFYVRDSCGVGDVSQWSGVQDFTTLCNPVTFTTSYTEDFDGTGWTTGTGVVNANNTIGSCWLRTPEAPTGFFNADFAWATGSGGTGTANTGPSSDVSGSGNYIYTEASGGSNQDVALISSPLIDITSLAVPELEFYYHRFGNSVGELKAQVWSQSTGWTDVWSVSGPQNQSSSNQAWIKESVTLNTYANDTIRVRFRGVRSFNVQCDLAVDEVSLQEAPTCPKPSNLSTNARTASSVELSWNSTGASSWQVEYGNAGFTPGSGTLTILNSNPVTVTGLSSGTTYDFYLRSVCSSSDTSTWIGPVTAPTLCNAVSTPYTENFDGSNWTSGTGVYNSGDALATCWWRNPGAGSSAVFPVFWGVRSTSGTTPNTGPDNDQSGSGNFVYLESSAGSNGQSAHLESPFLDLSSLTVPELRFYYHMYGNSMGTLSVDVYSATNANWTSGVFSISGQQHNNGSAAWTEAKVDLSSFSGDSVIVRFVGTKGNERRSDMAIDEVSVDEKPVCPAPDSLSASSITQTSVQLSWITGGSTNWQIEYGPNGYTPGSGTLVSANTNPITVTGLSPSQSYDFYVRDSCGNGSLSQWEGPLPIQMNCGLSNAPWSENFDNAAWVTGTGALNSGNQISNCWSRPGVANPNFGTGTGTTQSGNTGPNSDYSGSGNYIYTETSGGATGSGSITSPRVVVGSSLSSPRLSFYYHLFGAGIDSLEVEIDNGSGFSKLYSLVGQQQSASADPWRLAQIDISSYSGDTVRIRFTATNSNFQGDAAIDEVAIKDIPCPKPSLLAASNVGASDVELSWSSGGASNWQIEYGIAGFSPGSGTLVNVSSNPATISGLSSNTTYDFYLRDSCGAGDVSAWVGPLSATTLCAVFTAPYTESFDDSTWVAGTGAQNVNNLINNCWRRPDPNNPNFGTASGPTGSANTGPNQDAGGSGKYIYTEYSGGVNGPGEITSPQVHVPASFTNPQLAFAYHMYGAGIDSLQVQISTGSGYNRLTSITGAQQSASADLWLREDVDLSSYSNDTVQIRFLGYGANFASDIALDDFALEDETCPEPTLIQVDTATTTSITLSWTTGGASNWQISYGPPGFNPAQGTVVTAGSNPFTVTGLSPSSVYEFYVRDSCAASDLSNWEGPELGATLCDTVTAPYSENFDYGFDEGATVGGVQNMGSTISPCWWRDSDSLYFWGGGSGGTPSGGTGPFGDHTSGNGNYVYVEASFAAAGSRAQLETPYIDLDTVPFPELRFWYHMRSNGAMGTLTWSIDTGGGSWIVLDSLAGDQGFNWLEAQTDLRDYAGKVIKLRFTGTKAAGANNFAGDMAIDDLRIQRGVSCPEPDSLSVMNRNFTSVQLDWKSGLATQWIVRATSSSGTAQYYSASAKPFVANGLSASTTYQICVRDSCGPGDVSSWICDSVSTLCSPFTAPYNENFDGASWQVGQGFNNAGNQIDNCWFRFSEDAPNFGTATNATASQNTGPASDVSGSGNYIYTEYSGVGDPYGEIFSPYILIDTALQSPELTFAYHMYGNDIDSLQVAAEFVNGNVSRLWSLSGSQQTSSADGYRRVGISLQNYSGDTIRLRFRGYGSGFASDIAIDEFSVKDPSCPAPDSLNVTSVAANSATVAWQGTGSNFQLEYGTPGFAPGAGNRVSNVASPYNLTGLTPGTYYDIYVRDSCSATDSSLWVGPVSIFTNCAVQPAPYFEDFEQGFSEGTGGANTGATIHPCWWQDSASAYFWGGGQGGTPSGGTGPAADYTTGAGNYVYAEASMGQDGDTAFLETPNIDLSNLSNPELSFWLHMFSQNQSMGSLRWEIYSGGSWTALDTITQSLGDFWLNQRSDLSAYANQTVKFRFVVNKGSGATSFQGDIAIDDLSVDEKLVCAVNTLPYSENFDGGNWREGTGATNNSDQIDPCWERPGSAQILWGTGTGATGSANTGPGSDVSGSGNYIYTEASRGGGSTWINTPEIFLDSLKVNPHLWFSYHLYGAAIDSFHIEVNDGSGWSGSLYSLTGQQQTSINDAWIRDSVDLSAYSGDTVKIRFGGSSQNFPGDIAIDEVEVDQYLFPCQDPDSLRVTNITKSGFQLNWRSFNPGQTTITYYDIPSGVSNMQVLRNLSSPYVFTGLQPNTSYVISLSDSCSPGVNTISLHDTVTTLPCDTAEAIFSSSSSFLNASFDGSASVNVDTLIWSFGDGNMDTAMSPNHIYAAAGMYTVTLVGFNECGSVDTTTQTIRVCDSLKASMNLSTIVDSVTYSAAASQGASGYIWDFGDGSSDTLSSGVHRYNSSGTYTVTLTVFNECGDTASTSTSISVCGAPRAEWTYTVLPSNGTSMTVQFDASASQNAVSYSWEFGDGNTGTGVSPTHTYVTPGLFYFVSLTVTNSCGDQDVKGFRMIDIGLDEVYLQQALNLYPNPADGRFAISWENPNLEVTGITLYDVSGKSLLQRSAGANLAKEVIVDVNNIPAGLYYVRIQTNAGMNFREVIIR